MYAVLSNTQISKVHYILIEPIVCLLMSLIFTNHYIKMIIPFLKWSSHTHESVHFLLACLFDHRLHDY